VARSSSNRFIRGSVHRWFSRTGPPDDTWRLSSKFAARGLQL